MKKMIPWILATAVIMLVFPWLAVTFIKGDGGMAVCFILFFAVNPIYAICSGAYAGKDIKIFWTLPIIIALFFLLGTWLFFRACLKIKNCTKHVFLSPFHDRIKKKGAFICQDVMN